MFASHHYYFILSSGTMTTVRLIYQIVLLISVAGRCTAIQMEYCSSNSVNSCTDYRMGGNETHAELIAINTLTKSFRIRCSATHPIRLVVNFQMFFLRGSPKLPTDLPNLMAPTEKSETFPIASKNSAIRQTEDGQMHYHQSLDLNPIEGMDGVIECHDYNDSTARVQMTIYVECDFRTFWDVTSKVHFFFIGSRNESILPCSFYGISDDEVAQLSVYKLQTSFMLTDGHASDACINATATAILSMPEELGLLNPNVDLSQWAGQDCDEDGFSTCSDAFNDNLNPEDCLQGSQSWPAYGPGRLQFNHFVLLQATQKNQSEGVAVSHFDHIRGVVLNETIDPTAEYICTKQSSDNPNVHAVSYIPLAEEARVRAEIRISENNETDQNLTCTVNDFLVNPKSTLRIVPVPCDSLTKCDAIFRPGSGLGKFTKEEKFLVLNTPDKSPFHIQVEVPIRTETERMVACSGIVFKSPDNSRHYVQEIFHIFKGFDERLHLASSNYSSEVVMSAKLSGQLQEGEPISVICRVKTFTLFPTIRFVLRYQIDNENADKMETVPPGLELGNVTSGDDRWTVTSVKTNLGAKEAERELVIFGSPQLKEITCEAPQIHRSDWIHATINMDIAPKSELSAAAISGITLGTVGIILIVIVVICLLLQYRKNTQVIRKLTSEEENEFCNGDKSSSATAEDGGVNIKHIGFPADLRLGLENLKIDRDKKLGEGEYGLCFTGELENRGSVAVKSVKPNADLNVFKGFLREVKIMAFVGQHDNIIQMFGAVVEDIRLGVCYAVVELSPYGDLLNILRKRAPSNAPSRNMPYANVIEEDEKLCGIPQLRTCHLVTLALHIARGMEYLSSKMLIHGDLATRNVLVFPNLVAKISDFGMSRRLYGSSDYMKKSKQAVPWRWMALESLQFLQFSQKTDMWAYAITLWEVFTFGDIPFPGRVWNEELMRDLENGVRPIKPRHAPEKIFKFISECWATSPEDRPSFSDAVAFFRDYTEHSYANFQGDVEA